MIPRQVTLLVADEIWYNLYGKAILQGVYNTDLVIPTNPTTVPQLLFYFMMETDIADPFKSLAAEITLPGQPPVRNLIPVTYPVPPALHAGRTRLYYRHPLLIQGAILQPGRIEAKVIHENGEIVVGTPWIQSFAPPPKAN